MSENIKVDGKFVKGNVTYFKIKIDSMIKYEIDQLGADQSSYQRLNYKISDNFTKFADKIVSGGDFSQTMTSLRDEVILECIETDKNSSSKMRPFFKDYMFDKIYTMGINIKKGILPDDFEQELEEARVELEEESKQHDEEEEKSENEVKVIVEDSVEEKPLDIVDLMWNYFLGGQKPTAPENEKNIKNEKKSKIKGE